MEVYKTPTEKILFIKYKKWLYSDKLIPESVIQEYKNDLKKLRKWKNLNITRKITT
jgi:hypothetical protein